MNDKPVSVRKRAANRNGLLCNTAVAFGVKLINLNASGPLKVIATMVCRLFLDIFGIGSLQVRKENNS